MKHMILISTEYIYDMVEYFNISSMLPFKRHKQKMNFKLDKGYKKKKKRTHFLENKSDLAST